MKDKKARAFIGLSLSDSHFEQVQHSKTAQEMWKSVCDIYEKHTLLNQLAARRRFYSAVMRESDRILDFAARIRQLSSTLKSMGVTVTDQDMAMTLLSGLPDRFDSLISALDAVSEDSNKFTFQFVISRCQQEEQRHIHRDQESIMKTETAALLATKGRPKGNCIHCGKHNDSSKCWRKYPHLAPEGHPFKNRHKALIGQKQDTLGEVDDSDVICLLADFQKPENLAPIPIPPNQIHSGWIIDSGCSAHLSYDRSIFTTYSPVKKRSVDLGANSSATIVGSGNVLLSLNIRGQFKKCLIKNVQHVPNLRYQLLSVSVITEQGMRVEFGKQHTLIKRMSDGSVVATGSKTRSGLYELNTLRRPAEVQEVSLLASISVWHERMAHISPTTIQEMARHDIVNGLKISNHSIMPCSGCLMGKGHRAPISKVRNSKSSSLLQLVHSDVVGPLQIRTLGGSQYLITFIDDYSKWTVAYLMKQKSEAFERFKEFKAMAEKHCSSKLIELHLHTNREALSQGMDCESNLKALRSDNGGEYLSHKFRTYLIQNGIRHELTVPYTPQQNGTAERMNRTIFDLTRSLLHHKNLPLKFWGEAAITAIYVRNRVVSQGLPPKVTPFHLWFGRKPDISHLRIFGSECWYVIPRKYVKKLDPRSRHALMMGYAAQSKAYKLWDIDLRKFVTSRDVYFLEEGDSAPSETIEFSQTNLAPIEEPLTMKIDESVPHQLHNTRRDSNTDRDAQVPSPPEESAPQNEQESQGLRRSTRNRNRPGEWWKATLTKPLPSNNSETALLADSSVPSSYAEATSPSNADFWLPGIRKEEQSILDNKTFSLVDRLPDMEVIPCRYVFRVKNGLPKVRIVAKGYQQIHGVNYFDTYAPVISFTAVRCFLAFVTQMNLHCDQMDVVTAFLNGDLEETIYMELPSGFTNRNTTGKVCHLHKAIYGLKQAPRQWYAKMNCFLIDELNFASCPDEPCLYYLHEPDCTVLVILYVDDLLIAGSSRSALDTLKMKFCKKFQMKDLGKVNEFLGITISRNRTEKVLQISQEAYIEKILTRFNMQHAKGICTPMETYPTKNLTDIDSASSQYPYREAVGSIMYLMVCTRPDIAYAISKLARHLDNPTHEHLTAVKRLLRYLSATRKKSITFRAKQSFTGIGFCDSDWGSCSDTRKSTEGFLFIIGGGAVSWRSKRQTVVATSSCEAEYISLCSAAKESIWLSRMIASVEGSATATAITIHVDNQGAIELARNNKLNPRTKHIDIRYHFVQSAVSEGLIQIKYIPGAKQTADPLTKPLQRVLFERHRTAMGLEDSVDSVAAIKGEY